jgi:phosphate transport system ATP-binding protein
MVKQHNISIRNLSVSYGKNHVLKNISVDIPDQSITAIIESTRGTEVTGEVLVKGQNIYAAEAEVTRIRRTMGLLSQRPYPLPMSIYANIAFGLKIHGLRKRKKLHEKVEHYLRIASLWDEVKDRLNEPASRLSIGQQQRLCLARGLAIEPFVILGDEPTSALDPMSSEWIEKKFLELKQQYTIVLVTHILRQARRLADYVIFMYMGEIIEHGPAADVLDNPKEKLTKEYVKGTIS